MVVVYALPVSDQITLSHLLSSHGCIDILINAIGMVGTNSISGWNTDFKNQSKEAWNQALDVNLTSVFFLIHFQNQSSKLI